MSTRYRDDTAALIPMLSERDIPEEVEYLKLQIEVFALETNTNKTKTKQNKTQTKTYF